MASAARHRLSSARARPTPSASGLLQLVLAGNERAIGETAIFRGAPGQAIGSADQDKELALAITPRALRIFRPAGFFMQPLATGGEKVMARHCRSTARATLIHVNAFGPPGS